MKPILLMAFLALGPALADQLPATPAYAAAYVYAVAPAASLAGTGPVGRVAAAFSTTPGPLTEPAHPAWLCGG
jgi:hypothetical protein